MRSCLVITTHERADALARVLASLAGQTRPPDEVVVAEDGSDPATATASVTSRARSTDSVGLVSRLCCRRRCTRGVMTTLRDGR